MTGPCAVINHGIAHIGPSGFIHFCSIQHSNVLLQMKTHKSKIKLDHQ